MRLRPSCLVLLAWGLCVSPAFATSTVINMSHDLVTLHIANQNLVPNDPSFDAQPGFNAALSYTLTHHVDVLTVDPGSYYLLTPTVPNGGNYVFGYQLADLTIDLAGSTWYLKDYNNGISCTDCQRVTLTNVQIDHIVPPYTQVTITSVDAAARRIAYATIAGWVDPVSFNGVMSPIGPMELWTLFFRGAGSVPNTSRTATKAPIAAGVIDVSGDPAPWGQPATLATLQPGDTMAVTMRGTGVPLGFYGGDSLTLSHATVWSSSNWAVIFTNTSNSVADDVRVQPRPGGHIGSDADGIHFAYARQNNHIRNCFVTGTVDDAFAMDSQYLATVVQATGARTLQVQRGFYGGQFTIGEPINFVNTVTTAETATAAVIQSMTPSTFSATDIITLTFDRDLPALTAGDGLIEGSATLRGQGSTIENNTVGDIPFGRGIWLNGNIGVAIRNNTIGHTSNGGIVIAQDTKAYPGAPAHDILIENNVLNGPVGPQASGVGSQIATGAIIVESTGLQFEFVPTHANSNIVIRGNHINGTGRSGIWVNELDGGTIENNTITNWNQYPNLSIFGVPADVAKQLQADWKQPIVIHNSGNVTAGGTPVSQYLAEGATGSFFDTQLALFNPSATDIALVNLTFQDQNATNTPYSLALSPHARQTLDVKTVPGLASASFSTRIDSNLHIVVDRTMSWDHTGYGSHAETAVDSPSTTWYLAEGSTSGDFSLFYLFQNPNDTTVTATVRYLRSFGASPVQKAYVLPPRSRTTIQVDDEGPEVASTDMSAAISATAPIIVERAMYRSSPTQVFAAGHESAGVVAPAPHWFLAEGATGPFFDLFILLANPNDTVAQVQIDYLLSNGVTYSKSYVVPANGRFTIPVDTEEIPAGSGQRPLTNVAVSSDITSTNGVPIIAERTMWWPSPELTADYWTEAHNSPGTTSTGTAWALAEGEIGGTQATETFVLIANTSTFAGQARATFYCEDGTTAERVLALEPRSRTTINVSADVPELAGKRFGTIVQTLGDTPAQIVVERAMYTSPNGVTWAAGTNAVATRLQ